MLKALLAGQIDAMEKRWSYDASYMRAVLDTSASAFLRFGLVTTLGRLRGAPPAAQAAAGIVGTLAEDCGPCTQISVDMASAGGVRPEVLRAILAGDEAAMGEDAALAYRFARASLERDMNACDPLRDEILRRWGKKGLLAISMALTTARMYPTLKYAMGYGKTCSKVTVSGEAAPFARPAMAQAA